MADIGEERRIIIVEPVTTPVPDHVPDTFPERVDEPDHAPGEPAEV